MRLDGHALRVLVRVGSQVQRRIGRQQDRLEELIEAAALHGGNVDEHRLAAVFLGNEPELGQLAAHLRGVSAFLVDLVDRDDDRHLGRLGVVERLDGLRLDAVVGGHHEHRDIGDLGTAGAHGRERLVTGGVDESDRALEVAAVRGDLVGTDVLGDAASLARHDVGLANRVEQLGLAVIDVTHDGDDRRPRREIGLVALVLAEVEVEGLQEFAILVLG